MSNSPLYDQIALALRQEIDDGHLKPHTPAPSERALSERFGVSRMTARAAVRALEGDGYVYRSGRRGTFVAEPRLELPIGSFTIDVAKAGHQPSAKLLSAETHIAGPEQTSQLGLTKGDAVHAIKRLRYVGDDPVAIENTYIAARLCPDLLEQRLEQSLWLLLEERYGVMVARAETLIEAVQPEVSDARLLQMKLRAPAIRLTRTVVDTTGRPIEFARDLYRADRAGFRVGTMLDLHEPRH
jgi:GntR family transcriptional regulator